MREHPIIFSSEMIRAILENRKFMTRRVVSKKVRDIILNGDRDTMTYEDQYGDSYPLTNLCPYGRIGDHLWVKETFGESGLNRIEYKAFPADGKNFRSVSKWKSSLFMSRKFSRIALEIIDIKVEKLQDIKYDEIRAEGIENTKFWYSIKYPYGFDDLWDSIHKKEHTWEDNPWVWVIEFKRIDNV